MDIHILTSEREELNKAIADKDAEIKKLFERQPPLDAALLTVQAGILQEQYKYLHDCKSKVVAQLAAAAAAQPQPGSSIGPRLSEPGMQRFWTALQSAVTTDGFLELESGAHFMGNPVYGSKMLVRKSYESLFKTISHSHRDMTNRGWVITGTPGIGKSFFKFPLMLWLIKEMSAAQIIVQVEGRRYQFKPGADVMEGSELDFEPELDKATTWWIVDMAKAYVRIAPTVLLSSPNKKNYGEFAKAPGVTMLYLGLWTTDEIATCRAMCYPGIPEDQVEALAYRWGNIPRFILEKANDAAAQSTLEDALSTCDLDAILKCIGEPDSAPEANHKIIHLDVRPSPEPSAQPEGSLDHRYKVMVIASPFVGSRLAERIAAQEADWLRRMVRQLDAPAYKAAAGALFEAYAHRRLQAGGMFKVRRLDAAHADSELGLSPATQSLVFRKLEEVSAAADGVYCLPPVHNFPAVDALQQPDRLFQMTIAQKRTVNPLGLKKARKQLRAAPPRLYFCVPGSLFATFTSVDSVAADVEQWALEVPGFA